MSRALNDSGYVSKEVRARIEQAVKDLNYQPNAGARTLRSGRSQLIGVMLPSLEVEFFARLAQRIEQYLFAEGYQALICSTAEDPVREKALSAHLCRKTDRRIAGRGHWWRAGRRCAKRHQSSHGRN